ncbi:hypothetical protein ACOSP7_004607 [Xanthoceras sorbifolium]
MSNTAKPSRPDSLFGPLFAHYLWSDEGCDVSWDKQQPVSLTWQRSTLSNITDIAPHVTPGLAYIKRMTCSTSMHIAH